MYDDETRELLGGLGALAEDWAESAELRALCDENPREALARYGVEFPEDDRRELRICRNDADTCHVVMPENPNVALADETMGAVAAGTTAGSAGTIGSGGTASSVTTTVSSLSSVGSAGSAGTAS